ncbi:hypothetical protein Tco_0103875 [Tanacetum coccineum]
MLKQRLAGGERRIHAQLTCCHRDPNDALYSVVSNNAEEEGWNESRNLLLQESSHDELGSKLLWSEAMTSVHQVDSRIGFKIFQVRRCN